MRNGISVGIVLVCIAGSVWSARRAASTYATLSCDQRHLHLGNARQQKEMQGTFVLRNDSFVRIVIDRIVPSYQCTGSIIGELDLASGSATKLDVTLRTGSYRGELKSDLAVLYRVADREELRKLDLSVAANIEPHYDVQPPTLVFARQVKASKTLTIKANYAPNFRIIKAVCSHSAFTIEVVSVPTPASHHVVKVTFDPNKWADDSTHPRITLKTDSEFEAYYYIDVRVLSSNQLTHVTRLTQ